MPLPAWLEINADPTTSCISILEMIMFGSSGRREPTRTGPADQLTANIVVGLLSI